MDDLPAVEEGDTLEQGPGDLAPVEVQAPGKEAFQVARPQHQCRMDTRLVVDSVEKLHDVGVP
jgi:hypothetical protein